MLLSLLHPPCRLMPGHDATRPSRWCTDTNSAGGLCHSDALALSREGFNQGVVVFVADDCARALADGMTPLRKTVRCIPVYATLLEVL